jgi:hypothetical protein
VLQAAGDVRSSASGEARPRGYITCGSPGLSPTFPAALYACDERPLSPLTLSPSSEGHSSAVKEGDEEEAHGSPAPDVHALQVTRSWEELSSAPKLGRPVRKMSEASIISDGDVAARRMAMLQRSLSVPPPPRLITAALHPSRPAARARLTRARGRASSFSNVHDAIHGAGTAGAGGSHRGSMSSNFSGSRRGSLTDVTAVGARRGSFRVPAAAHVRVAPPGFAPVARTLSTQHLEAEAEDATAASAAFARADSASNHNHNWTIRPVGSSECVRAPVRAPARRRARPRGGAADRAGAAGARPKRRTRRGGAGAWRRWTDRSQGKRRRP